MSDLTFPFANLVDARFGVVSALFVEQELFGQMHWARAASNLRPELPGFGVAAEPELAATKAIAEVLERHYSYFPKDSILHVGSSESLGRTQKVLTSSQHLSMGSDETELRWVEAQDYNGQESILIPEDFIGLHGCQRKIHQPTTSGLAIHSTETQAKLSALLECIERDSFLCSWWNKIPLRQIQLARPTGVLRWLQDNQVPNFKFYMVPNEFKIPTVACVFRGHLSQAQPQIVVTSAAALDWESCFEKSFHECVLASTLTQRNMQKPRSCFSGNWNEEILNFIDNTHLYAQSGNDLISGFLSDEPAVTAPTHESADIQGLEEVCTVLKRFGYSPCFYNFNHAELRQIGLSLYRCFVPGFLQLNGRHVDRDPQLPRTKEYRKLFADSDQDSFSINPFPHPLP